MSRENASTDAQTTPTTASADLTNAEAVRLLQGADSGVRPQSGRLAYRFVKRTFDIVASGSAIVVLAIPSAVLSAVIVAKSPGAGPFYSQARVGRVNQDGTYKIFRMWKFRSMVPDADERLAELKYMNEADGPLFKIKDDPRIIPGVGKFIRRHSIDELPQLLNVFVGDMSLIGPRPGLPCEIAQYDERAKRRLTVKAGCGGVWQAGERSDSSFIGMVDADLDYVENCSAGYDLRLVLGTIRSMFHGGGAY
ncbi:sugar transferase [Paratractidigestivibacter sp.]|uniref:sugar transferase n=1 Tax=Paratractidigestivibacter sp. TaxID=2847316 RepID=UPI002ABDEBE5|nr:sugar transferase [Paratractidigestivibacter sp.]